MKYCSNAIRPKETWIEKIRLKLFTHLTHSFGKNNIKENGKKSCNNNIKSCKTFKSITLDE